ncbi:TCP-1/cpn60 chaperonin family protein [Haloferax sp. DFSO52]|uniref:TCP-1/cpn60 chaperonin family protein n=1 Tax=Haloferax sp. DFSO52 TaxID=3388505 RepID=UPI003A84D486
MSSLHQNDRLSADSPASVTEDPPIPRFPHANCIAVRAMANVLGSSLGPRSHDKLVVNQLASQTEPVNRGDAPIDIFTVTGDGATLLEELPIEHPIAPIVRRVLGPERPGTTAIEGQDIPDGITSTVVLTGALLDEAENLIDDGLHPHDIREGYGIAVETALDVLSAQNRLLSTFDDQRATEQAVARSAMTGNDIGELADAWARMAVDAVDEIGRPTEKTFVVRCLGEGDLASSRLVRGAVLDRNTRANDEMPRRVEDATVLLLDGHTTGGLQDPEWDEDAVFDLQSPDQLRDVRELYASRRRALVDQYVSLGIDVVVTRLGINAEYQRLLTDAGILGIRSVSALEMKQVALATGASLVRNPTDVEASDLGHAGVVSIERTSPRRGRRKNRYMTVFDECEDADSVAMVVHGVSGQLADQAATEIRKAAAAVAASRGLGSAQPGVVPGAGAIELQMAEAVRDRATQLDTRAQLAVVAFADALQEIVATLVRNAGYDPLTLIADLRAAQVNGQRDAGFVIPAGSVASATDVGVFDPVAYKYRMLVSASEVTDLILRVDDAIDATFTKEPLGPDDVIYDDRAEKHLDYLEETPGTRWDT